VDTTEVRTIQHKPNTSNALFKSTPVDTYRDLMALSDMLYHAFWNYVQSKSC